MPKRCTTHCSKGLHAWPTFAAHSRSGKTRFCTLCRAEARKDCCRAGHKYTEENTRWVTNHFGSQVRQCKRCERARQDTKRARAKEARPKRETPTSPNAPFTSSEMNREYKLYQERLSAGRVKVGRVYTYGARAA